MLLLSRVCAEFHDREGNKLFSVTPLTRLTFQEAPESIRQDPLFEMLLHDHSIEVAEDTSRRKQFENDPIENDPSKNDPEKAEAPKPESAAPAKKPAAKKE